MYKKAEKLFLSLKLKQSQPKKSKAYTLGKKKIEIFRKLLIKFPLIKNQQHTQQ